MNKVPAGRSAIADDSDAGLLLHLKDRAHGVALARGKLPTIAVLTGVMTTSMKVQPAVQQISLPCHITGILARQIDHQ